MPATTNLYTITADNAVNSEGDLGTTEFTFTVSRTSGSGTGKVRYAVTGDIVDGAEASDFAGGAWPSGTVSFAKGETSKTVTILVAGNTIGETDENFTVTLSHATRGDIDTATATGTILNDDGQVLRNITVFQNSNFVDMATDGSGEGVNIENSLRNILNTNVSTFTDYSASGLAAALAEQDVFVLPEQEFGSLGTALNRKSIAVIQDFVSNGGTLIVSDDYAGFMDTVFNFSLNLSGTGDSTQTTAVSGTTFGDDPATLLWQDATDAFTNLPSGAASIYEDGSGGATVFVADYGTGHVISLGWDWYGPNTDENVGGTPGWEQVLESSVFFI
jgi:hypothetical protein